MGFVQMLFPPGWERTKNPDLIRLSLPAVVDELSAEWRKRGVTTGVQTGRAES